MALEEDLQNAINNDLPNQIGSHLRERLEQANNDATDLKGARSQIVDLQADNLSLASKLRHFENTEQLERELDARQRDLEVREAVLKVREEIAMQGKQDMHNILMQVFKGPAVQAAFNANLYGNANTPMGSHTLNLTGDVTQKEE